MNFLFSSISLISFGDDVASDASGRYRGQFLFDNNHWLGSILECEGVQKVDEMELSFFVVTTLIQSPEPMIEVRIYVVIFVVVDPVHVRCGVKT